MLSGMFRVDIAILTTWLRLWSRATMLTAE